MLVTFDVNVTASPGTASVRSAVSVFASCGMALPPFTFSATAIESQLAAPGTQAPAMHMSPAVHMLPSSHEAPSALAGFEQAPLDGSQVPARWHWSAAPQTTGFAPVQTPAWQLSDCVQALPSLQEAPSASAGFEQSPLAGSQTPAA